MPTVDSEMAEIRDVIDNSIINVKQSVTITRSIIKQCIPCLKSGIDDGDLWFPSHHSRYRFHVILYLLFNPMIVYNPIVLLKSTIVFIPKYYNKLLSSSGNDRGIFIINSILKLFDNVLLLYLYRLRLSTSDMQFGFKARHSTSLCTLIFNEVAKHYVKNKEMCIVVF